MIQYFSKSLFLALFLVCGMWVPLTSPAWAQQSANTLPPSCSKEFMDRLLNKGWMEAQREQMTNNASIWKPDSVLQLTCFDQQMGVIQKFGGVFSESNPQNQDANMKFDDVAIATAQNIAIGYLGNDPDPRMGNFYNQFAGGRKNAPMAPTPSFTEAATINCNEMKNLWTYSQCGNVDMGHLVALDQLAYDTSLQDPRKHYGQCNKMAEIRGSYKGYMDQIRQGGPGFKDFNKASLFNNVVAPVSQAGSCFEAGIKTGVTLTGNTPEIICPNPGCVPKEGKCQKM